MREITWLKSLTSFCQLLLEQLSTHTSNPYTAAPPPTLETRMEIQASRNISKVCSETLDKQTERVQDEDMVINGSQGEKLLDGR